jgi:cobyrinic acid a,c-diamide synthase
VEGCLREEMRGGRPSVVLAALRGGSGKTLLAVGLLANWRHRGMTVVPFKKGPDYIDAAWLGRASGLECHHLDPFLMAPERLLSSYLRYSSEGDGALIEGNRGLYDGVDSRGTYSTAELAKYLRAPVVVVLDATKTTRTAAAMVLGLRHMDPDLELRGIVLNRVAGARHESVLVKSIEQYAGLPVLGAIPRLKGLRFPERHLGLVPPQEHGSHLDVITRAGEAVRRYVDSESIWKVARGAGELRGVDSSGERASPVATGRFRVGLIKDEVFHFYYPENLEALEERGAEVVSLNALEARGLPPVDALYIGGGFPEMRAEQLAANNSLRREIRGAVESGLPVYAECGGLMYLGRALRVRGEEFPMIGALPVVTEIHSRPQGHGYTALEVIEENPFFPLGLTVKGHEFHYSRIASLSEEEVRFAFKVTRGTGLDGKREGMVRKNVLATYTHLHALGCDAWADGISCRARDRCEGRPLESDGVWNEARRVFAREAR